MEKQIKFSDEIANDLDNAVVNFGFETDSEFIVEAVKEKLLQLKKLMFLNITNDVALGLRKKRISNAELLNDFEKYHSLSLDEN
jgi:hypothetical protein